MNSKSFFILTLIFTAACFFWWADQLHRQEKALYANSIEQLHLKLDNAKLQVSAAFKNQTPEVIGDFIHRQYPELQYAITGNQTKVKLRIQPNLLQELEHKKDYALLRIYILGAFFLTLLIVAFAWIYKSLNQAISLNRQQNNFLLAVTHELKTPVAAMKLMWDSIERNQDAEKQKTFIGLGQKESERMAELIENILMATQLDSSELPLDSKPTDLKAILNEYYKRYKAMQDNQPELSLTLPKSLKVNGDEIGLKMALYNLLDNAKKYAPQSSQITCNAIERDNDWEIQVQDQGPGIPDSEKKKVFDKFYRLGNESKRTTKGTGLGLFLVKEIIRRHKGRIWITDNEPAGSIFHLLIPKL